MYFDSKQIATTGTLVELFREEGRNSGEIKVFL